MKRDNEDLNIFSMSMQLKLNTCLIIHLQSDLRTQII